MRDDRSSRWLLGPLACSLLASLAAAQAHAGSLAYVRASSQLDYVAAPERFHPLNLVDDNPDTIWCEGSDGLGEGEEIRFYFKGKQKIDRILIGPAAASGREILTVRVTDGTNSLRLELGKQYLDKTLSSPMVGSVFIVSIEQVGAPNKVGKQPDTVACLSDIVFFYRRKPFGGGIDSTNLRYDKFKDGILGNWNGEPLGAPEKFLLFAIDGTWEWDFKPLMGGRPKHVTGEYRFRGNRLLMRRGESGRWADVNMKRAPVPVDPSQVGAPQSDYWTLRLNEVLGEEIGGEYNNAVF